MAQDTNRDSKLMTAAVVAVLLEISEGQALTPSGQRNSGESWSRDHRRVLIGRRNLFRARTRRSTTR
ncbi:MAG: hypothetical protein VX204_02750 [Candidatus Thermoplasmatota archaeon]|nr:hypothetical protein [Candidatus Thermoplasmatota archaeon]MEE3270013.1 hypothetical protein [Candidatus Thermoplasmatota archaeon]